MKFLRTDNIIRLTKGGVKYKVWQHQVTSALLMALYQVSSEAVSGVISAFPNLKQNTNKINTKDISKTGSKIHLNHNFRKKME